MLTRFSVNSGTKANPSGLLCIPELMQPDDALCFFRQVVAAAASPIRLSVRQTLVGPCGAYGGSEEAAAGPKPHGSRRPKTMSGRQCDRIAKLNGLIKRNDYHLNASGVLA